MPELLTPSFLRAAGALAAPDAPAALEAVLRRLLEEASAAWPAVAMPDGHFIAHLGRVVGTGAPAAERLALLHAEDLYLACGCALGDSRALAELERLHLPQVAAWVRRVDPSPAFADEVRQVLRERLLVGDGRPPRIAEYSGRGRLESWLQVAALRTALNLRRAQRRDTDPIDDEIEAALSVPDAELRLVKERHREDFRAALRVAAARLPTRTRQAIRLHYVDGLSLEKIAALHGVNRSTVWRWITLAQTELERDVRSDLAARLGVAGAELESLLAVVRSGVELSLGGWLPSEAS